MTKRERNRYIMFKAVQSVLKEFLTDIQATPAFFRNYENFEKQLTIIDELESQYKTVAKGSTAQKNSLRERLEDELDTFCGCISSYASESGNLQLKALVLSESEINNLRDSEISEKARDIAKILVQEEVALKDYDVTPESTTAFKQVIAEYDQSLTQKDTKANISVVARNSLKAAFLTANEILIERIDKMIKKCSKQNPLFYNRYQQARNVKDFGIRHEETETPSPATDSEMVSA